MRGNNGLTKRKFLTFTIEADNLKMARARLTRIETDLLGYFKTMGAVAHVLDAKERLEVLHGVLHPDAEPFQFEWKWLAPVRPLHQRFYCPVLVPLRQFPDVRAGRQVWGRELP